ncbi:MAG: hypothetical protein ISQ50_02840 [Synechococcus sp. BS307-5m-G36]|nr:hypothetical protein [Synechococcus sp. BS307-5m-G36]MBL6880307.1 hypothetical protein [Synechococcus sp. BS30m-G31]
MRYGQFSPRTKSIASRSHVNCEPTANQLCACEPCICSVFPEKAVEKEGKVYCSQPCADGYAGHDQCCSSCECC